MNGVALVIVLACLVLLSGVILAFFTAVRTDIQASKSYADNNSTRLLADTAVNCVMAQIRQATTEQGMAWASQPGMIRTFDTKGALVNAYKLYSSGQMTENTQARLNVNLAKEETAMASWRLQPAFFTDLNEPDDGVFPILADPTVSVEGYHVGTPPGATPSQPVPMPATWLYMLQDGTLVAPVVTGSDSIVTVSGATSANPIVGRIAFWTDDETCKININTASEGTYWDTPHFEGTTERNFGKYQFAHSEFQRYPGHPATVCLSSALQGFLPALTAEDIYGLTPRVVGGGSTQGTKVPASSLATALDSDRLYSTVDEYLFNPALSGTNRSTQQGLTPDNIQQLRFFLTAHSRAPELNLFGHPRISIWPIYADYASTIGTSYVTPWDRLSAFCSTLAGNPYYFQRSSATSTTTDIKLARNNTLLNYLDTVTSWDIPGFVGNFKTKYGTKETRQILTEIFDYIRCTNPHDSIIENPYADRLPKNSNWVSGRNQITPSIHKSWDTQGFGRFHRLSEVSILFAGIGRGQLVTAGTDAAVDIDANQIPLDVPRALPKDNMAVQAYILLTFFDPGQGWAKMLPWFTVKIEGLDQFKLNGDPMKFPSAPTECVNGMYTGLYAGDSARGNMDFRGMLGFRTLSQTGGGESRMPFYSTILSVPLTSPNTTDPRMDFQGGTIKVSVYANQGQTDADLIQTYTIDFPSNSKTPVPGLAKYRRIGSSRSPGYSDINAMTSGTGDRFDTVYDSCTYAVAIENADVVLSTDLKSGDFRQLARTSITSDYYAEHPLNGALSKTSHFAHGFVSGNGKPFAGATQGTLIKGAVYPSNSVDSVMAAPVVPYGIDGIAGAGDWDTGVAGTCDGAYINKPDDGNIADIDIPDGCPYFNYKFLYTSDVFSSPNRIVPSPMMFGSLPTGIISKNSWQTLLFRPDNSNHPGAADPKDFLFADLFWMPVVEPYAESEPASTAGKINMNYQILPYTYITRSTALCAAMKAEKIAAVPISKSSTYKLDTKFNSVRSNLNLDETNGSLRNFKERFSSGDIFHSATEICDIWLVPSGQYWISNTNAASFWSANQLTGDNVRERPYANLYAKLTTKSNTYQVHYRVQSLHKLTKSTQTTWEEGKDLVTGEKRGSTIIERYLDHSDTTLTDFAAYPSQTKSLETAYQFRIINSTSFHP